MCPVSHHRRRQRRSYCDLRGVSAIQPCNRLSGYLDLLLLAKCEYEERHETAERSESGHPPDMPDQRKAGNNGKEGIDEAGRSVVRHFDRLVLSRFGRLAFLWTPGFFGPEPR